ncbi:LLM class flavin-dependent oxidoreductase [Xylanimonas ulmi]|uniref:LLM class flavin-dependent oxidoreductase n=1 Tax=Xylanimonas ulmi TaxID=228973 RepID=UPI0013EE6742|nr:LLM class flavin-dependent oxidoreductase [Xylanibacterium ulmi]
MADVAIAGGIDTFWLGEGLLEMPAFPVWSGGMEPLTWLAYLAGQHPGIRVGLGASVLPLRDVQWLAKQSATLDQLTAGNHVLALAPGFWASEFAYRGVDFESRGAALDGLLDALVAAFAGEPYASAHVRLADGARLSPRPHNGVAPQLWLAGGAATMRRAQERGWPFQARGASPAELAPTTRTWFEGGGGLLGLRVAVRVTDEPTSSAHLSGYAVTGSPVEVAQTLADYAALGVCDVSLIPGHDDEASLATTKALVDEVLPRLADLTAGL